MSKSKVLPGRAYTIEAYADPLLERDFGVTHRVIGHTLGPKHPHVVMVGSLEMCEAAKRECEKRLRRYDFKVIERRAAA